jgi:hypothetical protein
LEGHRSWRLIGREVGYPGLAAELGGHWRNLRDNWSVEWTGVREGASAHMSLAAREARTQLLTFLSSFVLNFLGTLAATALENHGHLTVKSVEKALFNGTVSGTITSAVAVLHDTTRWGTLRMGLSNMDWAGSRNNPLMHQTDSWETDTGVRRFPMRWRMATYTYLNGLAVGGISSFVYNSADAAIFGVAGQQRTGDQALLAGLWGAASTGLLGVTTGLAQNAWHFAASGRLYSRGGLGDMVWAATENTVQSYLGYEWESGHGTDIVPSRPFQNSSQTSPPPPAM